MRGGREKRDYSKYLIHIYSLDGRMTLPDWCILHLILSARAEFESLGICFKRQSGPVLNEPQESEASESPFSQAQTWDLLHLPQGS